MTISRSHDLLILQLVRSQIHVGLLALKNMRRRQRMVMFVVAIIGAIGQAIILWHDLADTYPYKAMSHPSGELYSTIGTFGFIAGALFSSLMAWYLSEKIVIWTAALTTIICPLLFLLVFVGFQLMTGVDWHTTDNYDHTTPLAVLKEFAETIKWLMIMGFGVGLFCGGTVKTIFIVLKRKQVTT